MRLRELLSGIYNEPIEERFAIYEILSLSCDSRTTEANSLFVALSGAQFNGNDYIKDAIAKGAKVIVQSKSVESVAAQPAGVCFLQVDHPKQFLQDLALRFYGNPSQKVRVFGVTGTNGKTTTTYFLESIVNRFGEKCAVIGTINYRIGKQVIPSKNTTPGFLENQKYLARLATEDVDYLFMEVSSHALAQGRVDLIDFRVAIFTNLTGDHLDYHKTMDEYFRAKALLFKNLSKNEVAVINVDDPYGQRLVGLTEARVYTYGMVLPAQVKARDIKFGFGGSTMTIATPSGDFELNTRMIGIHNVYNMLAAVGAGLADGIPLEAIKAGLEDVRVIPGRLEAVDCGQDFFVFIDYAHTEDGLKNVLQALRATGNAKVITVFGCGGDRDRTKRPKMGKIACDMSDYSIVTTDNPRSEDPQAIIDEITPGFSKDNYEIVVDRTAAIHKALAMANKGDVVLIAGKGHETYQVLKDRTIDYDERAIVRDFFKIKK